MSPLQACWLVKPSPQQWYRQQHGPLGLWSGELKDIIACQQSELLCLEHGTNAICTLQRASLRPNFTCNTC